MKYFITTWSCTHSAARTMADLAACSVCCPAASHSSDLADRVWKQDNQMIWLIDFTASHLYMAGWRRKNLALGSCYMLFTPHQPIFISSSTQPMWVIISVTPALLTQSQYITLLPHLKCFSSTWIWVLHFLFDRLLLNNGELLSLADQLLFELLLGLGFQELLSEGHVGEHGRKCSAQFRRRLGAFLKGFIGKWITLLFIWKSMKMHI